MSGITRGDVFYIEHHHTEGSEMKAGRPAVIVSNNFCNGVNPVVEVVYLTTRPKYNMETHVKVRCTSRESTALCEQITTVAKSRVGTWAARLSDDEMEAIDEALMMSLGLCEYSYNQEPVNPTASFDRPAEDLPSIALLTAERDLYRNMYEELLNRVIPSKVM